MIDYSQLTIPFSTTDIEWRIGQSRFNNGKPWATVLAYITNRAIQERLDTVCGPENWKNEYRPGPDGGVLCGISIWDEGKKEWITKWDGAANTEVKENGKDDKDTNVKGGLSASMKRAGSQWGIGRYLYSLPIGKAIFREGGAFNSKFKDQSGQDKWFSWDPPSLPNWALPNDQNSPPPQPKLSAQDEADMNRCLAARKILGYTMDQLKEEKARLKTYAAVADHLEKLVKEQASVEAAADEGFGTKAEQVAQLFGGEVQ